MLRRFIRLWDEVLDFVYPPKCLACFADEHARGTPHLCKGCFESLYAETVPAPIDYSEQFTNLGRQTSFDECHAAWPYSEKMQRLIHAMKYDGKPSIARLLAKGISSRVNHLKLPSRENVVIVPVPMHSRRQRERGYNQSALIAIELAALWKLPVNTKSLRRMRDTPQQALLSADERRRNVHDAFRVQPATAFVSRDILLVDDVVTTGSTVNACAEALRAGGVLRIFIAAAAHA